MRRYPVLLLIVLAGCSAKGEEYTNSKGGFSVVFPTTPDDTPDPDLPRGVSRVHLVERSGNYNVSWEKLDLEGKTPEDRLERVSDQSAESFKGSKLLSRKAIDLDGADAGLEYTLEWPDGYGQTRARIFLAKGTLYQVVVSGSSWWMNRSEVNRFFDSFRLLD